MAIARRMQLGGGDSVRVCLCVCVLGGGGGGGPSYPMVLFPQPDAARAQRLVDMQEMESSVNQSTNKLLGL